MCRCPLDLCETGGGEVWLLAGPGALRICLLSCCALRKCLLVTPNLGVLYSKACMKRLFRLRSCGSAAHRLLFLFSLSSSATSHGASNTQGTAECTHLWLLGVRGRSSCCFSHTWTGKPFPSLHLFSHKSLAAWLWSSPGRGAHSHTNSRAGRCLSGLPWKPNLPLENLIRKTRSQLTGHRVSLAY